MKRWGLTIAVISGIWRGLDALGNVDFIKVVLQTPNHWVWAVAGWAIETVLNWGWLLTLPVSLVMLWGKSAHEMKSGVMRVAETIKRRVASLRKAGTPSGDAMADRIEMSDSVRIELKQSPPEFLFRADMHPGGIILKAAQIFDRTSGHKGRIMLTNIQRVDDSGLRHTVSAFHTGARFMQGPLELTAAGTGSELHYGQDCIWWLLTGTADRPRIPYKWGSTPERYEERPHPLGRYVATVVIEAGGKRTERTVQYHLDGKAMEMEAIGP